MMAVGVIAYKRGLIHDNATNDIVNILLMIVSPIIMANSFQVVFSLNKLNEIFITFILSLICRILCFIIAALFIKKDCRLERFAVIFPNFTYFGIPIVQSLLGNQYIFYLTIFMACNEIFCWTYGIYLVSGRRDLITVKRAFVNPPMIGLYFGLVLFLSPVKLPDIITGTMTTIGNINTPLAMIILGCYIAKSNILEIIKNKKGYFVGILRLLVCPVCVMLLLKFVPETLHGIKMVILIASSCPSALILAMFSQRYHADYEYGARIVNLSTILSLLTIPIILYMSAYIW
jgi:Predicted permeases